MTNKEQTVGAAPSVLANRDINVSSSNMAGSRYVLRISAIAALGGLLFGYDTAIISGAIPFIRQYFHLDEYSLGWAVSSILIGCGIGAAAAGIVADHFGRRLTLMICALLFAVSGAGAGVAGTRFVFIAFRLIGGLGVGAAAMVSPMYIAEMAPPASRGRLVSLYQLAIMSGILLAYLCNYALADAGGHNWRWMFASQVAPALLFLALLITAPETPRWLVAQGRSLEARVILGKAGIKETEEAFTEISRSVLQEGKSRWRNVLSAQYMPVIRMGVLIALFQQITGINSIIYYAPVILRQTGLSTSGSLFQTVGIGIINIIATLVAIAMVDKVGRKPLLLGGSFLMGVSLGVLSLCFYNHYFGGYVIIIALLMYVASFAATWGAVAWVYLAEIFPNRIRAIAMSVATTALWIGDFIVTYTFPIMNERLGIATAFLIYALACVVIFLFILNRVTETRNRSLEEIEKSFVTA